MKVGGGGEQQPKVKGVWQPKVKGVCVPGGAQPKKQTPFTLGRIKAFKNPPPPPSPLPPLPLPLAPAQRFSFIKLLSGPQPKKQTPVTIIKYRNRCTTLIPDIQGNP